MSGFKPNVAIHPGRTLEKHMEFFGVSQKWVAIRTGLTEKHISDIIKGNASITASTAVRLANVFGGSAKFWINLDANYREDKARIEMRQQAAKEVDELDRGAFDELVKIGWIEDSDDDVQKVLIVRNFFGVNSLKMIYKTQPVEFRVRNNRRKIDKFLIAAWLRKGEIEGMKGDVAEYNRKKLINELPRIRSLTTKKTDVVLSEVGDILRDCGVALVLTKSLPRTYINGATRWLGRNPLIQLSDYGKRDDIIWFTLFHEIGHVLLHGKKESFVEADFDHIEKDNKEKEADEFASKELLSKKNYNIFIDKYGDRINKKEILIFASNENVSPSIVLGRLQRDGRVPYHKYNELHSKFCIV